MSLLNIIDIQKRKIIFKNSAEILCGHVFLIVKILFFIFKNGQKCITPPFIVTIFAKAYTESIRRPGNKRSLK